MHDIRALAADASGRCSSVGPSAQLVDTKAAIARSPARWPAGIIACATFVLLFLMFGSVVVPLKAIVLNLLSLTATFGAMVWVFQEGHGASLLASPPTGMTDTTTPILMFCIAFGLSMDYEVFLLSRIKEEHDRTGDNAASVAMGLERTGRIVTAAAALLAVTFLGLRHVEHHVHQALRPGSRPRRADGRHARPGHARAGLHAARGRGQLVGAALDAADLRPVRVQRVGDRNRPTSAGSGPRSSSGDPDVLAASLGLVEGSRGLEERVELTGVEESTPLR